MARTPAPTTVLSVRDTYKGTWKFPTGIDEIDHTADPAGLPNDPNLLLAPTQPSSARCRQRCDEYTAARHFTLEE